MVQVIAIVAGVVLGYLLSRALRRPTSAGTAASVVRSARSSVGGGRNLALPALQRSVLSEVHRHVRRGVDGRPEVPAGLLVHLHPSDEARVQEAPGFFRRGLIGAITDEGGRLGWTVPPHVRIETTADPTRPAGAPAVSLLDAGAGAPPRRPAAPTPAPSPAPVPARSPAPAPGPPVGRRPAPAVLATDPVTVALGPGIDAGGVDGGAVLERVDEPATRHLLDADRVVIGRSATADLRIDDSRVSRAHLTIERSGRRWTATDEGSSNGSWVNGHPLASGMAHLLRDGDGLRVGPASYTFRTLPTPTSDATRHLGDDPTRALGGDATRVVGGDGGGTDRR